MNIIDFYNKVTPYYFILTKKIMNRIRAYFNKVTI